MGLLSIVIAIPLYALLLSSPRPVEAQEIEAQHALGREWGINDIAALSSSPSACHLTCTALHAALPNKVHYTHLSGTDPPASFRLSYYTAQQREITPACIVQPHSAQDVAIAVRTIAEADPRAPAAAGSSSDDGEAQQCIFAIKSGGHATFAGASNAPGGVTIDLCFLDEVAVSEDRETVALGPGGRWGEVYRKLDPYGLVVTGGRDNSVGVGGFLLGGGISFFARRYGWSLDNIRNFEVVLGNGSVVEANPSFNPDLYHALRGGGSNFGIVTRFDMEAHPRTPMWGGVKVHLLSDIGRRKEVMGLRRPFELTPNWIAQKLADGALGLACRLGLCISSETMIQDFERMVANWDADPFAQMFIAIALLDKVKMWGMFVSQVHGKAEPNPAVFDDFKKMPAIYKTTRIANHSDLTQEMSQLNAPGYRQIWNQFTFRVNSTLMSKIVDVFLEECEPMWKMNGITPALDFMIIGNEEIKHFSKNGGNSLGLSAEREPLLLVLVALGWSSAALDVDISRIADSLRTRFIALGKNMGLFHPYVYQNYAYKGEDVFAGYGAESRARLKKIRDEYDPNGLFGSRMPGHFKL